MRIALILEGVKRTPYIDSLASGLKQLEHEVVLLHGLIYATTFLKSCDARAVVLIEAKADRFTLALHAVLAEAFPDIRFSVIGMNDEMAKVGIITECAGTNELRAAHQSFIPDATALYNNLLYRPPAA